MNRKRALLLTSLTLGLISLTLALLGGIHLQHFINNGGGRHLGETVILIILHWDCLQVQCGLANRNVRRGDKNQASEIRQITVSSILTPEVG
jgi:hypothetical protein